MKLLFSVVLVLGVNALMSQTHNTGSISQDKRYHQLVEIINKNTGSAHMTRGMNSHTIDALKDSTTAKDIPVLEKMLKDPDNIVVMTTVNVLMGMGKEGRKAIYETCINSTDEKYLHSITDQLYSNANTNEVSTWKEDVPLLMKMTEKNNFEVINIGVNFLSMIGEDGKKILTDIYNKTSNPTTKLLIKEKLMIH